MCAVLDTLSQSNGQRLLGPRRRGGGGSERAMTSRNPKERGLRIYPLIPRTYPTSRTTHVILRKDRGLQHVREPTFKRSPTGIKPPRWEGK